MSVSLLIVSHSGVGSALLGTALHILGDSSLDARLLTIERDSEPGIMSQHAVALTEELNKGDGVLILTDLPGSTAGNVAASAIGSQNVRVVAGLNLPMLIKIMNYPELDLGELATLAIEGGQEGIREINPDNSHAI